MIYYVNIIIIMKYAFSFSAFIYFMTSCSLCSTCIASLGKLTYPADAMT